MTAADRKNPFPGPRHYDAQSIVRCVERKNLTEALLRSIRVESFTLVFGPSGSGKSSILCGTIQRDLQWPNFLYNQWRPGDSLEQLQKAVLSALEEQVHGIDKSILEWFLCLNTAIPTSAHDVVLIFDQIDHLFSPAFGESERAAVLAWLAKIAVPRQTDYHGKVKVVFGVRDDYLGLLISALVDHNQFPKCYFQIPRLRQSEILATASRAVPAWASSEKSDALKEQLKATYIHKNTEDLDPEINAPLAQILLYERYEDERLCGQEVSFATVMRHYFVSKTKALVGAAGTSQAVSFFKTLAQKFVDGKQKRICSAADLNNGDAGSGSAWESALDNLISANLITAVGAGENRTYALSHDSLCEIIESEHQQAAALAGADAASDAARSDERKTAAVYSVAANSAIASMKEMSTASVRYAEQQGDQRIRELKEGHQREVDNLSRLHLATVEREQAARRLAQQELQQAHKREQDQLKQFHRSQLAQLRQQHVSEVEGLSRTLGQQVADTQAESERRALEEQRTQEEIAAQLLAAEAKREGVEKQLSREQTARANVETQLSQEQTARANVETQLSQEQTVHAEANAQLSQTRARLADAKKALSAEQQTSAKRQRLLDWGGRIAGVALTATLGTAGYGWMRAQTLQAKLRVEQVGRQDESAKCKVEEAVGRQQRQAERRVGLAQCLLHKSCGQGGVPASIPRNPNRAASLLLEIPADLRGKLPLWSATAKQILQRGRVRVTDVPLDEGTPSGIVYRETGEVLVLLGGKAGGQKVLAFRDEGAAPGTVSRLNPGLLSAEPAASPLWRAKWEGRLAAWPSAAKLFLAAERGRRDLQDCARRTLDVARNHHPFAVIPFVGRNDSRVLILTGEGILLRDAACRGLAETQNIPETWLKDDRRLGAFPYQHAIVDDNGSFVVAATGADLRTVALPDPSARAPSTDDTLMTLDVTGSVLDVRFRPGSGGRLAVASGQQVSFWDLGAAQRQAENDLPRFATDCMEPKHRQDWLAESPQEAIAAYTQCVQRTGRDQ